MFKYPSPWQVLCSNLEKREQVTVNGEKGSQNLLQSELQIESTYEQCVTDSVNSQELISFECHNTNSQPNEVTEKEEIKTCILTVIEPEVKNEARLQEKYINDKKDTTDRLEEQQPHVTTSYTSTSQVPEMDRVTRSLIFSISSQENVMNSTTEERQVAEKTHQNRDVWVPPPDRNNRLKKLREEEQFEIRSHLPENSPAKLFTDSDEENEDKVEKRSGKYTPEKAWELEKERRDIIKKQGQRKSLDTEDMITIRDEGGASDIDHYGSGSGQDVAEVDTEKINFEAARQQFVMLEKKRKSLPITPSLHFRSFRQSSYSLNENDGLEFTKVKDTFMKEQDVKSQKDKLAVTQELAGIEKKPKLLCKGFSELSVDSLDIREEGKQSEIDTEKSSQEIPEETENIPNPNDETPIEREIRLAMQREEILRKERGILSLGQTKEMVEIPKNTVLSLSSDLQSSKKSKDRARTSFFLQREIEKEVQREADLKSEGRVAGLYDKGNAQELDVRRKVFEQPDDIPVNPQKATTKINSTGITGNPKEDVAQADLDQNTEQKNWTVVDANQPYSVRAKWKPASLNTYRNRRLSADNILDLKIPTETSSEKEDSQTKYLQSKENFNVQPSTIQMYVQENEGENEKNHNMDRKKSQTFTSAKLYNTRLRPSLSNLIEQEIQQSLQRDRELQEQRRKSEFEPVTIPTDNQPTIPHNGYNHYGRTSWTSDVPAASRGTLLPSHSVSSVQMFRPRTYPKFAVSESVPHRLKRHDNWYAGIDPRDDVNTEIVASTRVIRHKNTMALRWEAGIYSNDPSN